MHIEKNVFDNVFNTVMDIKGKTKDNPKARQDMAEICKRLYLNLIQRGAAGQLSKPIAQYTLSKEDRLIICKWVSTLRFPDGYVSNLSRCIDLNERKLTGMKSHDCHVFMERLLPIALKELLQKATTLSKQWAVIFP